MRWSSALSTAADLTTAFTEVKREISAQLDGAGPDLIFAFVSPHFHQSYERIPDLIQRHFAPRTLIGCTAMGFVGAGREVDPQSPPSPTLSINAAVLPNVDLHPFYIDDATPLPDGDAAPWAWTELIQVPQEPVPHFVILGDPYTYDPRPLLMGLDFAYTSGTKTGGLASAQGGNCLFLNDKTYEKGLVGLALQGNIVVDAVVAQGCRPLGQALTVTEGQGNMLTALDDRPAIEVLHELYQALPAEEQSLMERALHIGIASTELQADFAQGDFLIRNLVNVDQERGALIIDDRVRSGQTVQFHVRDSQTATEDLHVMLENYQVQPTDTLPVGALLFTCTGRGQHLFGQANHDSNLFANMLGDIPLGGFFCGGEIGQVGAATYLHGYTSSFGIFRPLHSDD